MSEEMFGPDPGDSGEWGGAVEPGDPGGESVGGIHDLGGGTFIQIDENVVRSILRSPEALAKMQARASQVLSIANSNHITKGAEYETVLVDNAGYKRPVIFVKPKNFKAVIDEKYHSTLLAAAAQVGSDPYIEPGQPMGEVGDMIT